MQLFAPKITAQTTRKYKVGWAYLPNNKRRNK